jgi:CHAD domain-containing protein
MARARPIELSPSDAFSRAAAKVVEVRAQELFDHAHGVLDMSDPERLHDMRVAARRLRAVLEIFAPCFPKAKHRPVLKEVKRLGDALGDRRDPDVQLAWLEAFVAEAPAEDREGASSLMHALEAEREAANRRLAEVLARELGHDLQDRLAELSRTAA